MDQHIDLAEVVVNLAKRPLDIGAIGYVGDQSQMAVAGNTVLLKRLRSVVD